MNLWGRDYGGERIESINKNVCHNNSLWSFGLNQDEQLFIEGNVIKLEEQSKLNEKRSILTGLYFKKCQTIQDIMYWDRIYLLSTINL